MLFKSPSDTPVYVSELSGHTAVIGSEWRELPLFMHRQALAAGCITDNMDKATIDAKLKASAPQKTNHDILVLTIKQMMENPSSGDFTASDLPNLKNLSKLAGWNVNREEMMQAVHAIGVEYEPV